MQILKNNNSNSIYRPELLAPAGSYDAFLGAIHAGADAVYLAGDRFGARAYANNFSEEELLRALDYAHLFGRKIYLTLNTLIKEREFGEIFSFLKPFYEAGLDGIIVQDVGVLCFLHEVFPDLPLHLSTQASACSGQAFDFYKSKGVVRIVPARETTMQELQSIMARSDLEVETFIHGAICYCYSGQCLYSSMLGERSGNRGRCAQPCRLAYSYGANREQYLLSLKDMCTLPHLPELIDAGISSFKIEGRMKAPAYAAGVTAIYRRAIDEYLDNPEGFQVRESDLDFLRGLYVRKDLQYGYYANRSGRDMITVSEPGYLKTDEKRIEQIEAEHLAMLKLPISMNIVIVENCPVQGSAESDGIIVSKEFAIPDVAVKQPLSEETVRKQFTKLGDTPFSCKDEDLTITVYGDVFLPMGKLNEYRRTLLDLLKEELLKKYRRTSMNTCLLGNGSTNACEKEKPCEKEKLLDRNCALRFSALCHSFDQWKVLRKAPNIQRIYVDWDLYMTNGPKLDSYRQEENPQEIILALPYLLREDRVDLVTKELKRLLENSTYDGFLIRDYGELQLLKELHSKKLHILDSNLYFWNRRAYSWIEEEPVTETTYPLELNVHELTEIQKANSELIVYGHMPLMKSANCIKKTCRTCNHQTEWIALEDRQKKSLPVLTICDQCMNILYNSVPLSLHKQLDRARTVSNRWRLEFTKESGSETEAILKTFFTGKENADFLKDYTKGHFERPVE